MVRALPRLLLPLGFVVSLGACDVGVSGIGYLDGDGGGTNNNGSDAGGGGGGGLPCDIDTLLKNDCQTCHGSTPTAGAPMSLVTYADLTRASFADPNMTFAQRSLARMQNAATPMPPKPATIPQADITAFAAWITAGTPTGTCGSMGGLDGGSNPNNPLYSNMAGNCTSNSMFTRGHNNNMEPGNTCIACHRLQGGPSYSVAGTVFPTGHEPTECNGATGSMSVSGATVIITDAAGTPHTLVVNQPSGNFYSGSRISTPYTAEVHFNGKVRKMATPQTDGDCNGCHDQTGSNNAPGRITVPY